MKIAYEIVNLVEKIVVGVSGVTEMVIHKWGNYRWLMGKILSRRHNWAVLSQECYSKKTK